jgi:hypothetical protein
MAIRKIQDLLQKENRNWHFQQLPHVLARYLDNEQDVQLAKLILKKENNWCEFARILDTGAMPIHLQLREINRSVKRIRKILSDIPVDFSAMANKRANKSSRDRALRRSQMA